MDIVCGTRTLNEPEEELKKELKPRIKVINRTDKPEATIRIISRTDELENTSKINIICRTDQEQKNKRAR